MLVSERLKKIKNWRKGTKAKPQEKVAPKKEVAKKDYLKRSSKDYTKHAKEKADYSNVNLK